MTLTIKLDRNWSSFQLANSAPPLSVTDSAIAPSARMVANMAGQRDNLANCAAYCISCARGHTHGLSSAHALSNVLASCKRLVSPQRVCCPQLCAMPVQHSRRPEQPQGDISPDKNATSKSPVADISVVTRKTADTTRPRRYD
jgi:hypothetical protein